MRAGVLEIRKIVSIGTSSYRVAHVDLVLVCSRHMNFTKNTFIGKY